MLTKGRKGITLIKLCLYRHSVSVKRDGKGVTEAFSRIACDEEETILLEFGAHVDIMERRLVSEIKRRRREAK